MQWKFIRRCKLVGVAMNFIYVVFYVVVLYLEQWWKPLEETATLLGLLKTRD